MNVRKKGESSSRSDLTRNRLFGALGHIHNPFAIDSHKGHDVEDYKQDEIIGNLRVMNLQVEMMKAKAILTAQSLVAHFQKS